MLIVPLSAVPSQVVSVTLSQQSCRMVVYQKAIGLFLDLFVNGVLIIGGVICEDRNRIVRDAYLGFTGDLAFFDTHGVDDPVSTGLGDRFVLVYLEPADLP